MKVIVVLLILCILAALGTALYSLMRHQGDSKRTVKALTVRIGLSIFLFVLLLLSYKAGLVHPHNLHGGM
ncbi:MAG: twin transmembrane helix small protein [Burkholderiales bacterium]|nr:twin transmembrane helix small protein [Burkholderiales bacterium]